MPHRRRLGLLAVVVLLVGGVAFLARPLSESPAVSTPVVVAPAPAPTSTLALTVPATPQGPVLPADPLTTWLWHLDGLILGGDGAAAGRLAMDLLRQRALQDPWFVLALRQRLIDLLPEMSGHDRTRAARLLVALRVDDATAQALASQLDVIGDPNLRTQVVRRTIDRLPADQLPSLLNNEEPRIRAAAAQALAKSDDATARKLLTDRLAQEADPRVRAQLERALDPAKAAAPAPRFGEDAAPHVRLPPADTAVTSRILSSIWDDGRNSTTVTVDAAGHAIVDTISRQDGLTWHVTYPAWTWRDAEGNTVVDARGQPVNYVQKPEFGGWSPDSLIIKPDGKTSTVDDNHSQRDGETAVPGAG